MHGAPGFLGRERYDVGLAQSVFLELHFVVGPLLERRGLEIRGLAAGGNHLLEMAAFVLRAVQLAVHRIDIVIGIDGEGIVALALGQGAAHCLLDRLDLIRLDHEVAVLGFGGFLGNEPLCAALTGPVVNTVEGCRGSLELLVARRMLTGPDFLADPAAVVHSLVEGPAFEYMRLLFHFLVE